MEKIIFFGLVIPIIAYVLYIGATAIMEGFKAKEANRAEKEEVNEEGDLNSSDKINTLSEELEKLNNLRESGVITQEEFEKAKSKLLDN
jgi:multidrug resistance efflux pump